MSSEKKSSVPANIVPVDMVAARKRNEDWIRAWKAANGVKKQSTLPTKVEEHTAWVLAQGWSMRDACAWKNLCEKVKFSASVPIDADLDLIQKTCEYASHLDTHPIGLICFARCELKQPEWTLRAVDAIRERFFADVIPVHEEDAETSQELAARMPIQPLVIESSEDDDERPSSGDGKRRKRDYEATQEYEI